MNRLLIDDLNINSITNKFHQLKLFVQGKVNVLVVTETKLDSTFPTSLFLIEVIVNHIALIETGKEVGFLFMFEMIYKANF